MTHGTRSLPIYAACIYAVGYCLTAFGYSPKTLHRQFKGNSNFACLFVDFDLLVFQSQFFAC